MKYEMFKDKRAEWRWRLRAENGEIIAVSSQGYSRKADCRRSIDLTKASGAAPIKEPRAKRRS